MENNSVKTPDSSTDSSRIESQVEVADATERPWELVGATRIWKTGEGGGAVAIIAEPECKNSNDFKEVWLSSPRWEEAMANAELIVRAVNSYDALVAALEAITMIAGNLPDETLESCGGDQ